MTGIYVHLRLVCRERPTRERLAFLGPFEATAATRGNELAVGLHVDADDVIGALAQAQRVVLEGIRGDIQDARVIATDGRLLPLDRSSGSGEGDGDGPRRRVRRRRGGAARTVPQTRRRRRPTSEPR